MKPPGSNVFAQRFAIDDFDRDGNTELVAGDSEGDLFIYESAATNTLQLEWQTQLPLKNITQLASGDLTGDGTPEFVVGGLLSLPDNPSGPLPSGSFSSLRIRRAATHYSQEQNERQRLQSPRTDGMLTALLSQM